MTHDRNGKIPHGRNEGGLTGGALQGRRKRRRARRARCRNNPRSRCPEQGRSRRCVVRKRPSSPRRRRVTDAPAAPGNTSNFRNAGSTLRIIEIARPTSRTRSPRKGTRTVPFRIPSRTCVGSQALTSKGNAQPV